MMHNTNPVKHRPVISVEITSRRNGRRFAIVSSLLSQMQLPHEAVFPPVRGLLLKGMERKAIQSPFCTIKTRRNSDCQLLVTDRQEILASGKTIHIDYNFEKYLGKALDENTLFLPIFFHPDLLTSNAYETASKLAAVKERPIKLLFAGNCDRNTYNRPQIKSRYGLHNRIELMQMAKDLPEDFTFFPQTLEEFEAALANGELQNKFVWLDTENFRIPQNQWLSLLGQAQYFFCTPGVHYPYCQNLNEAMACGCVPVLQYPDFYNPPLTDGLNCRVFNNAEQLSKTVSELLSNNTLDNWQTESKNAASYHADYLGLSVAGNRINAFLNDDTKSEMTWVLAGKT